MNPMAILRRMIYRKRMAKVTARLAGKPTVPGWHTPPEIPAWAIEVYKALMTEMDKLSSSNPKVATHIGKAASQLKSGLARSSRIGPAA